MEEKQIKKKKTKWILGAIGVFLLIGILSSFGNEGNNNNTANKNDTSQAASSSPPFDWATTDVTEGNVKTALSNKAPVSPISEDSSYSKNITKVEITDSAKAGQKSISVTYKAGDAWDETDYVKRAGGTVIAAGSILFLNPKVDQVVLISQTEMTDQYGKSNMETGVKIVLSRETANKIDWNGIAERHVTDPGNIYRIADSYGIHPGVRKNVKPDKVQLK